VVDPLGQPIDGEKGINKTEPLERKALGLKPEHELIAHGYRNQSH
jgi:hypothetical protein